MASVESDKHTEILDIIEKRLIPDEAAKKARGEVFTPLNLVREMLYGLRKSDPTKIWGMRDGALFDDDPEDRIGGIPLDVWQNPESKWLDPANGIGNFPFVAFLMLDFQLSKTMKDASARKKHIVEKMLYMIEIDKGNVNTARKIFETLVPAAKSNICCADTLKLKKEDLMREFGVSEFDVVMGNPPFGYPGKSGDNKLYLNFIEFSNKLITTHGGFVVFVVPSSTLDYARMTKKRKYFDKLYNFIFINDGDKHIKSYFKGVGSTFIYFVYSNVGEYVDTDVIKYEKSGTPTLLKRNIFENETFSDRDSLIFSKIFDTKVNYDFKKFIFHNGKVRRIRVSKDEDSANDFTNKHISNVKTPIFKYKIIDTVNVTNPFPGIFFYTDEPDDDIERDKIVFSTKGYLTPTIDRTHEYTYSDGFRYILCEGENCEELYTIFKSPVIEFIISRIKKSGYFDNAFFEKLGKLKSIKGVRNNDDVYKALGVEDHKAYIESAISSKKKAKGGRRTRSKARRSRQRAR